MTRSGYINAAFRSSRANEAYFFIYNKYVLLNYAPGTGNDKLILGPTPVRDGFKSLNQTIFGSYGIYCSFDTDNNQAFIFYENFCALIDYAPHSDQDKILSGPKKIVDMFLFFKQTVFENGVDAAFRSTRGKEVYLFKGDQYARIDYGNNSLLQNIKNITDGFTCFRGTIFESGTDAAFASHITNEAYFFKDDYYARVVVTPGSTNDHLIDGVRKTLDYWRSLWGIIP
ncbi:albumin-2-like [Vicia villosa]|uniref:albumin-2-like n=1 Tax=Vicia villosa TaxID=3911 RepID=UPI00273C8A0A|nr:albumin-2-like [Vicia villosa]